MTKYLPLLTLSLLASCVEPFDIQTNDSSPVIVIYGCLTDEPGFHTVKVSASSPYFSTSLNRSVSGAKVKITATDNTLMYFHEIDSVPGLYATAIRTAGVPGMTYVLSVETDFDNDGIAETYTATSTMPSVAELDSVEIQSMRMIGYNFYMLNVYAQDPPAEDYYLGRYKVNDSLVLAAINHLSPMSDAAFNGQYIKGLTVQRFRDINDREKIESEDSDDERRMRVYLAPGDTVTFSLSRIEKGYYDFIVQCQNEMNGENPFFGGPASNIISNISNGGTGYFTAYAFATAKTVVPEETKKTKN
jgi:hypothetical protein